MEQAWMGTPAELKSGIVTAALPPLMPARLWTVWLEVPGQKGRGCHAHQMWRKIWDNLYGVLKTCGLSILGCISTKEQNYVGKNSSNVNLVLNISMMKVLMWTLSAFLALFHNSCLKQHRDMFNLICVLLTKTQARSGCQTRSLSPVLLVASDPWISVSQEQFAYSLDLVICSMVQCSLLCRVPMG